jgi:hypothetical protein
MYCNLEESSRYYITPGVSSLECLIQMLLIFLKKGIMTAMPVLGSKSSVAYKLFTLRLKREAFSITLE